MANPIILDIETAPLDPMPQPPEGILEKGLGNLKDEAKIAAKQKSNVEGWYDRAALHPVRSQVVAIGIYQLEEDPEEAITIYSREHTEDEYELLASALLNLPLCDVYGFNVWWDVRFLVARCLQLGMPLANGFFVRDWKHKEAAEKLITEFRYMPAWIHDLQEIYSCGFDITGLSLDYWATEILHLKAKPYGKGEQVPEWYREGKWHEIHTHLEADLRMCAEMYERLR